VRERGFRVLKKAGVTCVRGSSARTCSMPRCLQGKLGGAGDTEVATRRRDGAAPVS
jgi:hypothetical protein